MKTCITCKFFKRGGFLDIRGDTCLHPLCTEKGFSHTDRVTGEVRRYVDRPQTCYIARVTTCGADGSYWEPK